MKNETAGILRRDTLIENVCMEIINRLLRDVNRCIPLTGIQHFAKRALSYIQFATNYDVRSLNSETVFNGIVITNVAETRIYLTGAASVQFSSRPYGLGCIYIRKRKKSQLPERRMHVSWGMNKVGVTSRLPFAFPPPREENSLHRARYSRGRKRRRFYFHETDYSRLSAPARFRPAKIYARLYIDIYTNI